ncbi:F-box/kelch-repeat protein [Cardamine amara subsp. amara]|uniref:F-box/kelch-repeat protein n=1 Tax=Cardamine amara subsp. amara TaxID=228776 RepID=A0ABD1BSI2_CARAN
MSISNSVDEENPQKKLKLSSPSQCGLSSLPDEVVLSCVVRVSRWDQPSLFLASKSYRSLMVSPDLYDLRSLMGCTKNFNYLCLRIPPDPNPRWFVFSPKRSQSSAASPSPITLLSASGRFLGGGPWSRDLCHQWEY